MRVGIIGTGQIARIHASEILKQPNAEIVAVADIDLTRATDFAAEFGGKSYEDAREMVVEQTPEVVHVLSPPETHAPMSLMALGEGCHVLVEKPMAQTTSDAKEMIRTAKERGVLLCADHNLLFDDVAQQAVGVAQNRAIGEVVSVNVSMSYDVRRAPALIEEGAEFSHWCYRLQGGLLEDLMPHPASLIMAFIGDIREIQSVGLNRGVLPGGFHDEIRVLVRSDRVLGYISLSLNEKPDVTTLSIRGTEGIVEADFFTGILTLRRQSDLPRAIIRGLTGFQNGMQTLGGSVKNIWKFARGRVDKSGGIGPVITHLYHAITHSGVPPVPLDASLRIVTMVEKIWPRAMDVPSRQDEGRSRSPRLTRPGPKALVTGGTGFIGIHLVERLLAEGLSVRVLVRKNSRHSGRLRNLDVDVVEGDLADRDVVGKAADGVKVIYHAGAATNNDWKENLRTTIKGTESLLDAAKAQSLERFVHFSTLAVYDIGGVRRGTSITENTPYLKEPRRAGAYAFAKIEAEKLVVKAYSEDGLPGTIVRPGLVFGPRGRLFFPHLGYRYRDKLFVLIANGSGVLPLVYVDSVVDGVYRASIYDSAVGQIYNLVDDGRITARDYLQQFVEITGRSVRIVSVPFLVPYMATAVYEAAAFLRVLKKGVTSRAQLKAKHRSLLFDTQKAKRELEWIPQMSLRDALTQTFEWHLKRSSS